MYDFLTTLTNRTGLSSGGVLSYDSSTLLDSSPCQIAIPKETYTFYMPEEKENKSMQKITIPMPVRMIKNGRATVVFFADDTKVVVKLPEGEEGNDYAAFTAALAKKMFVTNTGVKRKIEKILDTSADEKIEAAKKAKAEAEARRQKEHDDKVTRMAKQIVLEKEAKAMAKQMMEESA